MFFKEFVNGIKAYGEAARLLFSRRFWWFLIFPAVIITGLYWGGHGLISLLGESVAGFLERTVGGWVESLSWLGWLGTSVGWVSRIALRILYLLVFFYWGGYLIMIFLSPVYSWLSERTEAHLTGHKYPFSVKQLIHEIIRGVLIAVGSMLVQTLLLLLLFIVSFIPLVGLFTPFISAVVTAYFYGFAFVDYAVERKKFRLGEGVKYINKHPGAVLGIGSLFAVSLLIPFFRIFVCGFVSLLSVMAGTIVIHTKPIKKIITI